MTANVIVRSFSGEVVFLAQGQDAPEWALEQLGDHVLDAPKLPDASKGYAALKAADLKALLAHRNQGREPAAQIEPASLRKDDLVAALTADDADLANAASANGEEQAATADVDAAEGQDADSEHQ